MFTYCSDNLVFTKGEEKLPENTGKTDEVDGYTQTTSYVIRKQGADQTSPQEIARGQIYLLGTMLTGIAGLWLVMRQRRKQLR